MLDLLEAGNVLYSSCSDVFQSLARKESLVTGNDHIWKGEQPREHIASIFNLRFTAKPSNCETYLAAKYATILVATGEIVGSTARDAN